MQNPPDDLLRSDEHHDNADMISKDSQPLPTSYGYVESHQHQHMRPLSRETMVRELEANGYRRIEEARNSGLPAELACTRFDRCCAKHFNSVIMKDFMRVERENLESNLLSPRVIPSHKVVKGKNVAKFARVSIGFGKAQTVGRKLLTSTKSPQHSGLSGFLGTDTSGNVQHTLPPFSSLSGTGRPDTRTLVLTPDPNKRSPPRLNAIPAPKVVLKAPLRPQAVTAVGGLRRKKLETDKKKSEAIGAARAVGMAGTHFDRWRRMTTTEMNKDIQNLVQSRAWRPHFVPPIKMEQDQASDLQWHDSIFGTNSKDLAELHASRQHSME